MRNEFEEGAGNDRTDFDSESGIGTILLAGRKTTEKRYVRAI
jgi:hypothetical protein